MSNQSLINILNFNPNLKKCYINSPRTIEAATRQGVKLNEIMAKTYEDFKKQ